MALEPQSSDGLTLSIAIERDPDGFRDWRAVLTLLQTAFAAQDGRIDPPSSVYRLTAESVAEKARQEHVFLARAGDPVVGCLFARRQGHALALGKLAVHPQWQRRGIGRRLMQAAEDYARHADVAMLELETRMELIENHIAFTSMGFARVGEHTHPGYDRPTSITMRKQVAGQS